MIGMVLPQSIFAVATVTVSGGTVTINTDKAGDLKAYLQNATLEEKTAISSASTIVFKGKYNSNDLQALSDAGCCTQSTVNMSEAYFIASSSSSSKILYHKDEDRQPANEGDHCLVGAKKHVVASSRSTWVPIEESEIPANADGTKNITTISEEDFGSYINNNEEYIRVPKTYHYYEVIIDNNNRSYKYVDDVSEIPSDATIHTPTVSEDRRGDVLWNYQDANNNSIQVNVGDYMRFGTSFNYYTNPETLIWKDVSGEGDYTNGTSSSNCYQSVNVAPTPTYEIQNTPIYIGGTESVYHDSQWVDPSEVSGNEEYDYTQMSFSYWGSNVTTAISSYNAGSGLVATDLCNGCSNLTNLTIGSGTVHSITTEGNKPPLTNLTIGNKVAKLGNGTDGVFADYSSITNLTFESGGTDPLEIEKNCFIRCRGISNELIIPARTTLIEQNAFTNLEALTTITFEETQTNWPALVIKKEAFSNISNVTRVNVNIDPSKKMMICEYNAFDYNELVAQTNVNGKSAVLHFPEEFFDFYAGNWKRNMTFDQDNLNQIKDGLTYGRTLNGITYVSGNTQSFADYTQIDTNKTDGKLDGYYHANGYPNTMYAPANGWQQFARTDTGIDIVIKQGHYFRTYSTENAQAKPEWMTIYRVTNFSDGYIKGQSNASSRTEANEATKEATVQEITESETGGNSLIPANTGVIRVDEVEKDALYYFMDWSYTGIAYQETWGFPHNETVGDAKVNFMVPTNDEEATQFGPVDRDATGITHRNFVLTADAVFMRAKPLTMAANRAYLKLPAGMFHWKDEGEGSSQIGELNGATPSQYSKISLLFIDDFEDVNGGIATEIINAIEEDMYKNDSFYTIQGVKVSKPTTKGVYIHNGKKVYIK